MEREKFVACWSQHRGQGLHYSSLPQSLAFLVIAMMAFLQVTNAAGTGTVGLVRFQQRGVAAGDTFLRYKGPSDPALPARPPYHPSHSPASHSATATDFTSATLSSAPINDANPSTIINPATDPGTTTTTTITTTTFNSTDTATNTVDSAATTNPTSATTVPTTDPTTGTNSSVSIPAPFPSLSTLTLCFRLVVVQERATCPILSYATPFNVEELLVEVIVLLGELRVRCCGLVMLTLPIQHLALQTTVSICVSIDLPSQTWGLVVGSGGRMTTNRSSHLPRNTTSSRIHGGGILYIGQVQSVYGGGLESLQSLRGSLVDLRLYDRLLPPAALVNYTTCHPDSSVTPVLDFSDIKRDFDVGAGDVKVREVSVNWNLCGGFQPFDLLLPHPYPFPLAATLCHSHGGIIPLPTNEVENFNLFHLMVRKKEVCVVYSIGMVWVGARQDHNLTWSHYTSARPLNYTKFSEVRPGFANEEGKCLSMKVGINYPDNKKGQWVASPCMKPRCVVCRFVNKVMLMVRGLCQTSLLDTRYHIGLEEDQLTLTGQYFSHITNIASSSNTSQGLGIWVMKQIDNQFAVQATLKLTSPTQFPVGLHEWLIENDLCESGNRKLVLTVCHRQQFTCYDGTCISLRHRCNQEVNCQDGSDEIGCQVVVLPEGYSSSIPPPLCKSTHPNVINLAIYILHIIDVDTSNFLLSLEVLVMVEWVDLRLSFINLKANKHMNLVELEELQPWTPSLEFLGDRKTSCRVRSAITFLEVRRLGPPQRDRIQNIHEDEVYSGRENSLLLTKKLSLTSTCEFDLIAFPFDKQLCRLEVRLLTPTVDIATLDSDLLQISFVGNRRLREYYFTSESIAYRSKENYSVVEVSLVLDNLATYFVTTTYVPTFIISVLGYLTLFFPLTAFSDRVMVGLTTLLVEAALFTQTSTSIPKTSYLKLMDVWFVFCIILLFVIIVAIVLINWFHAKESNVKAGERGDLAWCLPQDDDGREVQGKNTSVVAAFPPPPALYNTPGGRWSSHHLNHLARIFFPLVALLFIITYIFCCRNL